MKLPVLLAIRDGAQGMHLEATGTRKPRFASAIMSNSDAARTAFLSSIADSSASFITTMDIDIKSCSIDTAAGPIKFQIFNSASDDQERFGSIANSFYSASDCIFIMHDSSETLARLLGKIQKDFRKHNLYTVLYDGHEILLLPYTPDNLFNALHHNHTPSNFGLAGRALLIEAAKHFDLGTAPTAEPVISAASAAATTEESSPRKGGFFGFFSTPPKITSAASASPPCYSALKFRTSELSLIPHHIDQIDKKNQLLRFL